LKRATVRFGDDPDAFPRLASRGPIEAQLKRPHGQKPDVSAAREPYASWSLVAPQSGAFLALAGVVAGEEGRFEIVDDQTIRFTTERCVSNVNHNGLTPQVDQVLVPNTPVVRPALTTLSGDRLLLFLGDGEPEQVDLAEERLILYPFECP